METKPDCCSEYRQLCLRWGKLKRREKHLFVFGTETLEKHSVEKAQLKFEFLNHECRQGIRTWQYDAWLARNKE